MIKANTSAPQIRIDKNKLIKFIIVFSIIVVEPLLIRTQWITGPIVNSLLLITTIIIGPTEGIFLGLIPSTIALGSGLLPIVLAPMIPFIMIGNALMIISFNYFWQKNSMLAIFLSAFVKFIFLYSMINVLQNIILHENISSILSVMMSWPQLITALLGGFIAFIFIKFTKKYESQK